MAHYDFYATKRVTGVGAKINEAVAQRLARLCSKNITPPSPSVPPSILEIGPGKGKFGDALRAMMPVDYKAYEADGILYKELVERRIKAVNAMVPPLPEGDGSFDCVALINVLEHLPGLASAESLVKEIARVLKPGGTFFIVVPSYLDWKKDFFNLDYTHQFITTEVRCRQLLEDHGFRIRCQSYHYGCFFSGIGRLFNSAARLARALLTLLLPRSFSRRDTVQKLGVLFAENIICIAEKP